MQRYTDMEDNEEKQFNFRALNCIKAREQRSKIKADRLLKEADEKAYIEVYSNLKKEKKKQLKLLELAQMNDEINKIKNNLLKYTSIQPQQQTLQQQIKPPQVNCYNSFRP